MLAQVENVNNKTIINIHVSDNKSISNTQCKFIIEHQINTYIYYNRHLQIIYVLLNYYRAISEQILLLTYQH